MIKFLPLGGTDDIGAGCFYLNIHGSGILLDCGIHPRKNGLESLPNFDIINDIALDFVLISHAHQDHIGALPFLVQKFPHAIIYSTPQTKEIADVTMHNAVNILNSTQASDSDFKIYNHEEIDLLVRSIRTVDYNTPISLKGMRHNSSSSIQVTFYDAGHILGSAAILIQFNDLKILYTGDINLSSQSIMNGADLSQIGRVNTLIVESTYAATDSALLGTWETELKRFTKSANKIINNGGSILIPVFALGKMQEMLSSIFQLIEKRKLTDTNIYTGGVSREISKLYDKNRYIVKRKNPNLELNSIPQLNIPDISDLNYFQKNNGIVLVSSGMMLPGTTSYKLLDFWLKQESFAIYGVGYMDPETPGYKVISSKQGDKILLYAGGPESAVRCSIERFYFPSHSNREKLLSIVDKTKPERVILVHGDSDAKDWLGFNILKHHEKMRVHSASVASEILISD